MAGYTDAAFRSVCVDFGAPLCFTEMVSADALARRNAKTLRLLERAPNESMLGFQIFASEPRTAAAAVRAIAPLGPALIDLNCGCSVSKVLKAKCGAILMRTPQLLESILAAMKGETDIPISVKMRSGWDASSINFLDCAEAAVKAGVSLVTLHPRTRAQGFSGRSQWDHIKILKQGCGVAVFGSGDLFSVSDCMDMLEQTRCDGVMIARGSLGNPFIFEEAIALLSGSDPPRPVSPERRLHTALRHLGLLAGILGEQVACREMRKHFVAYTKGMEGGAIIRQNVVYAKTIEEYEEIVESYLRK
jgi:nifR3 family TIM-barrel protein